MVDKIVIKQWEGFKEVVLQVQNKHIPVIKKGRAPMPDLHT